MGFLSDLLFKGRCSTMYYFLLLRVFPSNRMSWKHVLVGPHSGATSVAVNRSPTNASSKLLTSRTLLSLPRGAPWFAVGVQLIVAWPSRLGSRPHPLPHQIPVPLYTLPCKGKPLPVPFGIGLGIESCRQLFESVVFKLVVFKLVLELPLVCWLGNRFHW